MINIIGNGSKLIVRELERLARELNDLANIVSRLESKGASLEILDQRVGTVTASREALLQMLGVFAEFETNLRKERQMAGIQKAKLEARYLGRKSVDDLKGNSAIELIKQGYSKQKVADIAGIGVATLY